LNPTAWNVSTRYGWCFAQYVHSEVFDLKPTSKLAPSCLKNSANLLQIWFLRMVSVSRFHVPQGRSKIAQRFIAGLWREHKTSPVRDERTHRSSPIFSVAPPAFAARQSAASARRRPGLWPFSTLNPRLKPWATFGRPYRDFGIRAPPFNMTSTTASSRRESAELTTRGACAGPTVNTYDAALYGSQDGCRYSREPALLNGYFAESCGARRRPLPNDG
jgi:hypothetical protein